MTAFNICTLELSVHLVKDDINSSFRPYVYYLVELFAQFLNCIYDSLMDTNDGRTRCMDGKMTSVYGLQRLAYSRDILAHDKGLPCYSTLLAYNNVAAGK